MFIPICFPLLIILHSPSIFIFYHFLLFFSFTSTSLFEPSFAHLLSLSSIHSSFYIHQPFATIYLFPFPSGHLFSTSLFIPSFSFYRLSHPSIPSSFKPLSTCMSPFLFPFHLIPFLLLPYSSLFSRFTNSSTPLLPLLLFLYPHVSSVSTIHLSSILPSSSLPSLYLSLPAYPSLS